MGHGSHFRALLAEALMKYEQSDEGLAVVNEALNAALSAGGCHFLAEFYRLKSARSPELRAVLSLSRLWRRQNKTKEARQTVLEIYNWFTEWFDTEDLKGARVLLEELS